MDPDKALGEIRSLLGQLELGGEVDGEDEFVEKADRLLGLVAGLDAWLAKGGALPRAWRAAGNAEAT